MLIQNILYDFPFYSLLALSFWISLRVLNFPDLALDSAYAMGMAVFANLTSAQVSLPLFLSLPLVILSGFLVGAMTGLLHEYKHFKLSKLLAGLVVSFCLYSILFRINGQKISTGLYSTVHEYNLLKEYLTNLNFVEDVNFYIFLLNVLILFFIFIVVYFLLKGKLGLRLRVAGYTKNLLIENGRYPLLYIIIGLGIADAIAAITGCLRSATDNYSDINVFGTFLYALSGLLLGEKLLSYFLYFKSRMHTLPVQMFSVMVGGLLISFIVQISIYLLGNVFNSYFSVDIKFIIGIAVWFSASAWNKKQSNENGTGFA